MQSLLSHNYQMCSTLVWQIYRIYSLDNLFTKWFYCYYYKLVSLRKDKQDAPFNKNTKIYTFMKYSTNKYFFLDKLLMHKYLQSYICSFIMMCHYNNIVMKTLSLQVQSKITQTTLLTIFAQYAPSKVGIKQSAIYLQIDENKCGEFTAHIKTGAFPELKYEIFQVLESPLNIQGCFEKCQEVFTSITQIKSFFLSKKLEPIEKKQQENEVSLSTNSVINSQIIYPEQQIQESNIECSNTILLDPVYESSEVIRIDFEDDTSPTRQHISIEPEAQSQELEVEKTVKIQLQEKFPPAVRSSNEDTSQFIQPKLVQNKGKDETEQKKNIDKAISPKEQALNNFMLLFLSLWIIWLII